MSQQQVPYDYGATGRDYWIADEGANLRDLTDMDLEWLRHFLSILEEFIRAKEEQDIAEIKARARAPVNWAEQYPWQWQDIVGTQLRQSHIVALMSVTERHLGYTIAEVGAVLSQESPSVTPGKTGKFMERAREFLVDTANFAKPTRETWDLVNNLRELRNVLVHCAGLLDDSERAQEVRRFVERTPELEMESGFVQVTPEFCQSVQMSIEGFFADLHEQHVALCRRLASARQVCQ